MRDAGRTLRRRLGRHAFGQGVPGQGDPDHGVLGYGTVTSVFLGLAAIAAAVADLHVTALHPWTDLTRFGAGFLRPDLAAVGLRALTLTVAFAVVGVGLGALTGLAASLVFARSRAARVVAAGLRSIHELFWALILAQVTGLSATTGVLAVAIPYAGIFAKVYAEMIEEMDRAPERALPAGTSALSRFLFVRLPVLAGSLRAYTLYRLECGLRSTLVLGFVGIPTLGFDLDGYFKDGYYREAAALILAFYALIATRGLWARAATLPVLVAGSVVALATLTTSYPGDPVGARLARFGHALIPRPLRDHAPASLETWRALATWAGALARDAIVPGTVETLVLSQLAAALAAAAALVLFPAISQRFSGPVGRVAARATLILLRGTPEYVFAYILLQLLGPSMLPAVLALGLHNGGIIGTLMGRHADALTYRRDAPGPLDLYAYETLPRLYGQFLALVLYRTEIIVREGAIVGILGVRTLGYHIDAALDDQKLDAALVLLGATAALSLAIDAGSRALRRRLRIEAMPVRSTSGPPAADRERFR